MPDDVEAEISNTNGSADRQQGDPRRKRTQRPFPAASFKEAAELAEAMVEIAGGSREVRRITLFDHLQRSPESGHSRQAVVNSSRYGLTEGGYQAETLRLTDDGLLAVGPDASSREKVRAQFRLAIDGIPAFKALYDRFSGNRLPAQQVMRDFLVDDQHLSGEHAREAVELFIVNARDIGMLRTLSGAERLVTLDHLLDLTPSTGARRTDSSGSETTAEPAIETPPASVLSTDDLSTVCFYVTPIGADGSDERRHADLILGQIVEPAIEALDLGLSVVRADRLTQPGMISQQILRHILGARLVVADLSFHNPNVFYELAIRHATGLPTVLVSRLSDRIPFDIADLRVVRLDMTDLYTFVPQMEAWRAELTQHARQALEHPEAAVTPITLLGPLRLSRDE